MHEDTRALARDLLAWYRAMGADEALEDVAVDWLARGDAGPGRSPAVAASKGPQQPVATSVGIGDRTEPSVGQRPARPVPSQHSATPAAARTGSGMTPGSRNPPAANLAQRQFHSATPDASIAAAREAARSAPTIEALAQALAAFDGCALKATAKNLCFYRGAATARLMLIGEAPGRDEDIEGRPFVGPAGQLLDKMLAAIGLTDEQCHITNVVYWRPPGNRTPSMIETQACRPFLERQIELVDPDVLVLLGGAAAKNLLEVEEGIMRLRGKWREIEIGGRKRRALATLHPAYLLRTPAQKRLAWRDWLAVSASLEAAT